MILVVGVAGSGKSTQSTMIADNEGWCWISMGQLLRNSLTGKLEKEMNSGKLLDDEKVESILKAELEKVAPVCRVVLDGFPRRVVQAHWLLQTAEEIGDSIEAVVHLQAHENVVLNRLLSRGRQDDRPEAINERFIEYENDIKPLLELFASKNIPIIEVDGEMAPELVHAAIMNKLNKVGINI